MYKFYEPFQVEGLRTEQPNNFGGFRIHYFSHGPKYEYDLYFMYCFSRLSIMYTYIHVLEGSHLGPNTI